MAHVSSLARLILVAWALMAASQAFAADLEFRCPTCRERFPNQPLLVRHLKEAHKPVRCGLCRQYFANLAALRAHLLDAHRQAPIDCPYCDSCFATHQERDDHLRKAHPIVPCERSFRCRRCRASFTSLANLMAHRKERHPEMMRQRIHRPAENTRSVPCPVCGLKFIQGSILREHLREVHPDRAPRRVRCPYCLKFLDNADALAVHVKTEHTNEPGMRTVRCPHCNDFVPKGKALEEHIHTAHPNARPSKN